MRSFNRDGSEGRMAGNSIRSVGKYVYDRGILPKTTLTVETASGVHTLTLYTRDGAVTLCGVTMGKADFAAASLPALTDAAELVNAPIEVGGKTYTVTCLSVGNPHCVVFDDRIDALDLEVLGPQFEHAPLFPERINTEFVRVVNRNMLKMRVYERGNGETPACGTGACAAATLSCASRRRASRSPARPDWSLKVWFTHNAAKTAACLQPCYYLPPSVREGDRVSGGRRFTESKTPPVGLRRQPPHRGG